MSCCDKKNKKAKDPIDRWLEKNTAMFAPVPTRWTYERSGEEEDDCCNGNCTTDKSKCGGCSGSCK